MEPRNDPIITGVDLKNHAYQDVTHFLEREFDLTLSKVAKKTLSYKSMCVVNQSGVMDEACNAIPFHNHMIEP